MDYQAEQQKWEAKKAASAFAAKQLQQAHPHLIPAGDSLTTAAKNIRIELSRAFPGVKFYVKTKRFSMGNDIRVCWTDGPNSEQVKRYTTKYSAGNFDGMTDSYDYRNDHAWVDAFGSGKYIFEEREYSDVAVAAAIRTVTQRYNHDGLTSPTVHDWRMGKANGSPILGGGYHNEWQGLIGRELAKRTWALDKTPRVQLKEAA